MKRNLFFPAFLLAVVSVLFLPVLDAHSDESLTTTIQQVSEVPQPDLGMSLGAELPREKQKQTLSPVLSPLMNDAPIETKSTLVTKMKTLMKSCVACGLDTATQFMLIPMFTMFFLTVHEFGHYSAAKLLVPTSSPEIHLFSNLSQVATLFSLGDLHVHADTLLKSFTLMRPFLERFSRMLMFAAGPCAGLIAMYLFFWIKAFIQKYRETKNFKSSIAFACAHGHTPFENLRERKDLNTLGFGVRLMVIFVLLSLVLDHVFYGFFPLMFGGDGWQLWQYFFNKDRAFKYDVCQMAKFGVPIGGSPVFNQYVEKHLDANFIKEVREFVAQQGSDWCHNSNNLMKLLFSRDLLTATSRCIVAAEIFLVLKTINCIADWRKVVDSVSHALKASLGSCWRKIVSPIVCTGVAVPGKLRDGLSLVSQKIATCRQGLLMTAQAQGG